LSRSGYVDVDTSILHANLGDPGLYVYPSRIPQITQNMNPNGKPRIK
jgi:hypothetical protein